MFADLCLSWSLLPELASALLKLRSSASNRGESESRVVINAPVTTRARLSMLKTAKRDLMVMQSGSKSPYAA